MGSILSPRDQQALVTEVETMRRRMGWAAGGLAAVGAVGSVLLAIRMLPATGHDGEAAVYMLLMLPLVAAGAPPILLALAYQLWYDARVFGSVVARRQPSLRLRAYSGMDERVLSESGLFPRAIFDGGKHKRYATQQLIEGTIDGWPVRFCHVTHSGLDGKQITCGLFLAIDLPQRVGEQVVVVPKGALLPEAAREGVALHETGEAGFAERLDAYASGPMSAAIALPPARCRALAALAERHPGMTAVFRMRRLYVLVPWRPWDGFKTGLTVPVERLSDLADFETLFDEGRAIVRAVCPEDSEAA